MRSSAPRSEAEERAGPLAGYRVLDLAGPLGVYCAKLLADLGVDVVRVEAPSGDPMRRLPPFLEDGGRGVGIGETGQVSLYYLHFNTSKRAVSLDLGRPRGRELFLRLVERADAVVESFPPGYLESLSLGYSSLRERNPGVVLTSITPFGQSGPYREYRASDLVGQAMGGLMSTTGYPGGPPLRLACDQGYHTVSVHACVGTLLALCHREATGEGQQVDASLQEAVALTIQPATQSWDLRGELLDCTNPRFGTTWACEDGYVSVAMGRVQAFERVAEWLCEEGMGEGLGEARWEDAAWVAAARPRVEEGLRQLLARYSKAEVVEEAQRRRLWMAPLNTAADIVADPQLAARDFFQEVGYPELGVALRHPGAPFKMSASPWRIAGRAPLPGEHDEAVYRGELGLSPAELAALRREGVIAEGPGDVGRPAPAGIRPGSAGVGPRSAAVGGFAVSPAPSPGSPGRPGPRPLAGDRAGRLPLAGLRILDFSWVAAGPLAAKMCADHGAEVILVESATRRGGLRGGQPMVPGKSGWNVSGWFNNLNTGKLGITVNLKRPEGVELVRRLVRISDVVLDNYTPGVMARWGLDYASLVEIKPDIVVMAMPVMGCTGPRRHFGGFGSSPLALSGIHHLTQLPGRGPAVGNHAFADHASNGGHGAVALLAALLYRRRTGRGQFIDLAQYESTLGVTGPYLLEYAANGTAPEPAGNHAREAAPHNAYRCLGDDRWCVIAVSTAEEWQALRRAMGEPAWAREERFATLEGRRAHEELLDHHLGEWTRQHTAEELMALLQSVGVPAGVVQNARDLLERDPHLRERGYFVTLEHPEAGPARYHRLAFQLSETPAQFRPAPLLGEHNDYVFGELLGLGEDEINHYIVEGIIE